jgi:hypothetical protein
MEWVVKTRGIESAGSCLQTMVDAFGELRRAISRLFADEGIGQLGRDGVVVIDPNGWYPIETELSVLKRMLDLNHRKNGLVMFDPATGVMLEGIGHFGYERTADRRVLVTAPGPFPCEFNRGIVAGLSARFQPKASVVLTARARA